MMPRLIAWSARNLLLVFFAPASPPLPESMPRPLRSTLFPISPTPSLVIGISGSGAAVIEIRSLSAETAMSPCRR